VGRYALAAMSLAAAIPAAILAYWSIMAWVHFAEHMSIMMKVVNGVLTPVSVLMTLMPVIIMVGRRRPKVEGAKAETDEAADEAAATADEAAPVEAGTGELVDVADSEMMDMPADVEDEVADADESLGEPSETDAYDFAAEDFDDAAEFEEDK